MKLLYITNGTNGSGGLERVLSVKASYLAEYYDYDVHILVLNDTHINPFYEFSPKLKYHSIPVGGNPIQYWQSYKSGIQKVVNQIEPDIISVCDDGLKGFFVPSLIKTNGKIIYERHASILLNTDDSLKGKLMKMLMQKQVSKFARFVALTKGNITEWNQSNVIAIPNPLSFETEQTNLLDQKRVIAVGSHSYNKGYDTLLRIWQEIENEFPDWQLNIFGKVDKDKRFIRLAQELQLKNVHFHQPVADIKAEYLQSSVMVLPSRSEGFGMVLVEAMACGVPCVAFDCPSGPTDIIKNNEDGFLVENQNQNDFIKLLTNLMKNESLRLKMGKAARENVKRFLPETILGEWDKLFKEII